MSAPIERQGRVVHCKRELFDIYIGRPSVWGNPFSHREGSIARYRVADRNEAISKYREWLLEQPNLVSLVRKKLAGKVLGCWCKPLSCHGDILLEVANGGLGEEWSR